jgi:hypothetical protein
VATHKPLRNIHFEYERAPADGTGDLGHCRYFAEISGFDRILEWHKLLHTGQVLFRRLSVVFALVLPFKDSQGGTSTLGL